MRVHEIESFQSFEDDWDKLLEQSRLSRNFFLTFDWLSLWWKHFGHEKKLRLLTVEDDGKTIALAPLMLSDYSLPILGHLHKIEFVGSPHSDYHDLIVLEKERQCLELLINYLRASYSDWDWVELKEVPETSETVNIMTQQLSKPSFTFKTKGRVCNTCPYLTVFNGTFESLLKGLSREWRQSIRRYLKKLRSDYSAEMMRHDEAGYSATEAVNKLIALHEKRWASGNRPGLFSRKGGDRFASFLVELAEHLHANGRVGLYFLMANDQPIAAHYNFEYRQRMYSYLAGLDPDYGRYSAGNLNIMLMLERCALNGYTEFDFMRGDEAYKSHWTQTYRKSFEFRVVNKGIRSRFCDYITWKDFFGAMAKKLQISLKPE